ncbi:hypothetical protein [Jiangella rhizosphaerae]|uniref:Uncharacterized protein n=1 Tax=Jiangella rhizosphaerae TaxID=2293569 RepID=A0A418KRU3_9ACTN|nr:hypothetical protein [Jiangella rhizosphaerae]RIQ24452.1 hypothetical protein DY240_11980 [Jiangella rhizosphaerae]
MGANGTVGGDRPLVLRAAGRTGRLIAGAAGLAIRAVTDVPQPGHRDRTPDGWGAPPPPPEPGGPARTAPVVRLTAARLGEATLGLAAVTTRRALDVAAAAAMPVEAAATIVVRAGTAVAGRSRLAGRVDRLARIGRAEQRRNEREAALLLRRAWRQSVASAVAAADVDAVIRRVDLDAVVRRIDVDAVVRRVDLDAVIVRLDIPVLVERVLDDIDLGRIVRESSTGAAAEAVDAVRSRSAGADRAINEFVDRVVLRRPSRDGTEPAPSEPGRRAPP